MPNGTSAADAFTAATGNSTFNGLGGVDTIIFDFKLTDATFTWIGNELIARVQVEEQFNMTIGFGASANRLNEIVQWHRSRDADSATIWFRELLKDASQELRVAEDKCA